MKAKLLLFMIIAGIKVLTAQSKSDSLIYYEYVKNSEIKFLKDKAIHPKALDKKMQKIFAAILLSGSNLSTDGSSFSYTISDDKTNLNLSSSFKIRKRTFLKVGIKSEGPSNIFTIYGDKSWSNSIGANIGAIFTFNNRTYYDSKNKEKLEFKRKNYLDSLQAYKSHLLGINLNTIEQQIDTLEAIVELQQLSSSRISNHSKKQLQSMTKWIIANKILKEIKHPNAFDKLNKLRKIVDEQKKLRKIISEKIEIEKNIEDDIVKYDLKNDISYGYKLNWFSLDFAFNNVTNNIEDSILNNVAIDKTINHLNFESSINYNHSRKNKNWIFFTQIGLHLSMGNYLDNPALKFDKSPLVVLNSGIYEIQDGEQTIGEYEKLKEVQWFSGTNFYVSIFYKKYIGFNLKFNHNFAINRIKSSPFENNFSFLVGPLFKHGGKKDWNKATFGIDLGFENAAYNKESLKNKFVTKIKIGVPFTIFTKAKQ